MLCLLLAVGAVVGCTFTGAEEERTLQERLLDPPEERQRAELEIVEQKGQYLVRRFALS